MLDGILVRVQSKYFTALPQKIDQIASISASGIQHAHFVGNVPTEDLIEDIDVNLSKLLLNVFRNTSRYRFGLVFGVSDQRGCGPLTLPSGPQSDQPKWRGEPEGNRRRVKL